jgi:hypothetical protein
MGSFQVRIVHFDTFFLAASGLTLKAQTLKMAAAGTIARSGATQR